MDIIISVIKIINILISFYIVFFQKRDTVAVWAWMLLLNFLPLTGFILFMFVGRSMYKNKITNLKEIPLELEEPYDIYNFNKNVLLDIEEEYLKIVNYNKRSSGTIITTNNHVEVFSSGVEKFAVLEKELKKAQKYVFIQYYIIKDDDVFDRLCEILIELRRKHIDIYILYDAVGSRKVSKKKWNELKKLGIKIAVFSPGILNKLNLNMNYRNHRKIVIIDGITGFMGGINIGKEYIGRDNRFGKWRDTHFMVKGDAVSALIISFIIDWNSSVIEEDKIRNKEIFVKDKINYGSNYLQIITSGPDSSNKVIHNNYLLIIESAKRNICIQTPYFIPDESIILALKNAVISGIEVNIMIPSKPDHPFVYWATYSYVGELLCLGARVYRYTEGFMHAKGIIADGKISSYGTANMDIRSFRLNYEVNFVIFNKELTEELDNIFTGDLQYCEELLLKTYKERNLMIRIKEQISRLFSSIL